MTDGSGPLDTLDTFFASDDTEPAPEPDPTEETEEASEEPIPRRRRRSALLHEDGYKKAFYVVSAFFVLSLVFYVGTIWITHSRSTRLKYYGEIAAATTAAKAETGPDEEAIPTLNVNTASAEELAKLPGLGLTRAEAIVSFRQEYGKITEAEDLLACPGIGRKTLEKFAEYLIFSTPDDSGEGTTDVTGQTASPSK